MLMTAVHGSLTGEGMGVAEKRLAAFDAEARGYRILVLLLLFIAPFVSAAFVGGSEQLGSVQGVLFSAIATLIAWAQRRRLHWQWGAFAVAMVLMWCSGLVLHAFFLEPGGGAASS